MVIGGEETGAQSNFGEVQRMINEIRLTGDPLRDVIALNQLENTVNRLLSYANDESLLTEMARILSGSSAWEHIYQTKQLLKYPSVYFQSQSRLSLRLKKGMGLNGVVMTVGFVDNGVAEELKELTEVLSTSGKTHNNPWRSKHVSYNPGDSVEVVEISKISQQPKKGSHPFEISYSTRGVAVSSSGNKAAINCFLNDFHHNHIGNGISSISR